MQDEKQKGLAGQQVSPYKERSVSNYYYGRPSPFLSNLMFMLNPAPDNLTASTIMSIVEIGFGVSLFRLGQRTRISNRWTSRFKRIGLYLISGHLLFCGGAQFLSNQLNGDDTILAADAKRQRLRLVAEGKEVNWWFGPKNYEYMSPEELQFLLNRSKLQTMTTLTMEASKILLKGEALSQENDKYFLNTIIPSLKGKRFNDGLVTTDKPALKLNDIKLAKDEDLNYVWFEVLDPWKELWQEVNLSINFVPKWNFIESDPIEKFQILEHKEDHDDVDENENEHKEKDSETIIVNRTT